MTSNQITIAVGVITFSGIGGSILLSLLKEKFYGLTIKARVTDYFFLASGLIYLLATLFTIKSLIGGKCYIPITLILVFIGTFILVLLVTIVLILLITHEVSQRITVKRIQAPIDR